MTNGGLPTESLLQIVQEVSWGSYSGWRRDLLSCAPVCYEWSFSLDLLLSDFQVPQNPSTRTCPPNPHALGKALAERPALGLSIKHLNTQYFRGPYWHLRNRDDSASLAAFTADLIAILHTARNLQNLEVLYPDGSQTEALASALYGLRHLSTFSTGKNNSVYPGDDGVISIVQLAYCLASWPSLKSLNMHGTQSPTMTESTAALRPPVCALAELTIKNVSMSGRELMHMMSSSLRTLERITLDSISGITNAGLRTFLDAISQNVSRLTIRHTGVSWCAGAEEERALNATIGKMRRLELLGVSGDVATELMLHRRPGMFISSRADGDLISRSALPVIKLRFHNVAGLPVSITCVDWSG
ncbi:hypothetical protein PAXRUDRAFT_9880 [Paxillus rubicundulus Ve08.2h10]|uniref:F-box domain-containing protein n=1 Tax=Paxillus rubicundulus Ve08.2h10 TaxID=930991 RepID=A0A0D0DUG0_9AGAM|nr:hypothetical protein PAXRUDRAFT_9880 [Paxillus rubicundulus Ve08.2h10]